MTLGQPSWLANDLEVQQAEAKGRQAVIEQTRRGSDWAFGTVRRCPVLQPPLFPCTHHASLDDACVLVETIHRRPCAVSVAGPLTQSAVLHRPYLWLSGIMKARVVKNVIGVFESKFQLPMFHSRIRHRRARRPRARLISRL